MARLPKQAYSKTASEAVFAELARLAGETASGGHAVIADATFIDGADRERVEAAAREVGAPFVGVWLEAPMAVLEKRVGTRRRDASDATLAVLQAAAQSGAGPGTWTAVDTQDGVAAAEAVRGLADVASRSASAGDGAYT